MRADDVYLVAFYPRERIQVDEFCEGPLADVEESEDRYPVCAGAGEGADFEETLLFVGGVDADGFADHRGAQDDGFVVCGLCCHGVDEGDVVFAWLVGDVDGAAGDAATCGVEGGVGVRGLEHVPVW